MRDLFAQGLPANPMLLAVLLVALPLLPAGAHQLLNAALSMYSQ